MNVNLELYRIFYIVAKNQNITKASKELCISQPAVSKHIKNLEEMLNTKLFTRTKRGLILTDTGSSIFKDVKKAIQLLENVDTNLEEFKTLNKGSIVIGISTTLTKLFLINYLLEFHRMYPNVTIDIRTDDSMTLKELLKEGKIDILFSKISKKDESSFYIKKLGELHYIFTCNKEYYQKLNGKISLNQLSKHSLLLQSNKSNARRIFDNFCMQNDINVESIMDIDSSNLLITFIKSGFGIGFITKEYALNELEKKELYELSCDKSLPKQDFGYVLLDCDINNLVVKKLIELIYEHINEKEHKFDKICKKV